MNGKVGESTIFRYFSNPGTFPCVLPQHVHFSYPMTAPREFPRKLTTITGQNHSVQNFLCTFRKALPRKSLLPLFSPQKITPSICSSSYKPGETVTNKATNLKQKWNVLTQTPHSTWEDRNLQLKNCRNFPDVQPFIWHFSNAGFFLLTPHTSPHSAHPHGLLPWWREAGNLHWQVAGHYKYLNHHCKAATLLPSTFRHVS